MRVQYLGKQDFSGEKNISHGAFNRVSSAKEWAVKKTEGYGFQLSVHRKFVNRYILTFVVHVISA